VAPEINVTVTMENRLNLVKGKSLL